MKQYLCKDHEGKFFIIEAPTEEEARDTAVLDGGEVVQNLNPESEVDELISGTRDLIDSTMKDFFSLPEVKFVARQVGLGIKRRSRKKNG